MHFTEDLFEQAVLELLEKMGYTHIYAPDMNRTDYSSPILEDVLRDSLVRLNKNCLWKPSMKLSPNLKALIPAVWFRGTWSSWIICKTASP